MKRTFIVSAYKKSVRNPVIPNGYNAIYSQCPILRRFMGLGYIMPMSGLIPEPPKSCFLNSSGSSPATTSVVKKAAILAAFCSADLVTMVGSIIQPLSYLHSSIKNVETDIWIRFLPSLLQLNLPHLRCWQFVLGSSRDFMTILRPILIVFQFQVIENRQNIDISSTSAGHDTFLHRRAGAIGHPLCGFSPSSLFQWRPLPNNRYTGKFGHSF